MQVFTIVFIALGIFLFYLQQSYGTIQPCAALSQSITEDSSEIVAYIRGEYAQSDQAIINKIVTDPSGVEQTKINPSIVDAAVGDTNILRCSLLIGYREFSKMSYIESTGDEILLKAQSLK